jgi:hypothetical protein
MTEQQRELAVERFPAARAKTTRLLLPDRDLEEPAGHDAAAFVDFSLQVEGLVRQRLDALLGNAEATPRGTSASR